MYLLKDYDQLKQLGTWQRLASEKQQTHSFFNRMGTEKTHFHQSKIIKTIAKSCNYQSNCKSIQNAHDTKPWKGCENRDLAAEKRVKISGVIAGGVTLFVGSLES